jgi:glycosyltransferase involved in cell wall biosynthesis
MHQPSCSVILCVRDGERFLKEALDSVARQRIEDLEMIVVDDGSKDNSARIARCHPARPIVVSQDAFGINGALNQGIRTSSGRFLTFVDCDDIWPEGRLAAMLTAIEQDETIDIVFGKVINTDENLRELGPPALARIAGCLLVRREAALKIGEFRTDIAHAAIVDWMSRAVKLGLRGYALDEVVLLRRIHGGNMGIGDRPQARTDLLRVVRDHLERTRQ